MPQPLTPIEDVLNLASGSNYPNEESKHSKFATNRTTVFKKKLRHPNSRQASKASSQRNHIGVERRETKELSQMETMIIGIQSQHNQFTDPIR